MEETRIPTLNNSFDFGTLIHILRRNAIFSVIVFTICIFCALIFLRYTPKVYKASSIIQINENNGLPLDEQSYERLYGQSSLENLIELIRSKEFLKSVINKLPLEISYFSKGTFLDFELYKNSPFFIEIKPNKTLLYDIPLNVVFINDKDFILTYNYMGVEHRYTLAANKWHDVNGLSFYLNISDFQKIKDDKQSLQENKFYFIVHSKEGAFNMHMSGGLDVTILNPEAKTIQISYQSNNPNKASDIADSIAKTFLSYNVLVKQRQANKVIEYVDLQLEIIRRSLDSAERALKKFKKTYNVKDMLDQQSLTNTQGTTIDDINSQNIIGIQKIENERKALSKMQSQIASGKNINTSELLSLLSDAQSESMIVKFLNAIDQLQRDKDILLINVTENNSRIKIINKQIEEQRQLLANYIKITTDQLLQEKSELTKTKKTKDTVKTIEYDEMKHTQLLRNYTVQQGFYNQLIEQKSKYSILRASVVTDNVILELANEPKEHIYPKKSVVISIALILGLLISLATIIAKYLVFNEITSPEDISKYTNAPIVGIIPNTKRNKNKENDRLLIENRPDSVFTESFRTLRSNLDFITNQNGSKVITISSTVSGEGKTFVAINLGGIMAFMGKRVIMLDLDLRKPKVHVALETSNDKGMSTLIVGKHQLKDCIQQSVVDKFDFITAGPLPPNPSELILKPEFDEIINQLKQTYDIIIIDTPPIGIVADAIYSYQKADFPLYITRVNYSKRNFVYNINYLRDERGVKNLSVVLNGIETINSRYGYGYSKKGKTIGYGYGYGYSYGWSEGYYSNNKKKKATIVTKIKQLFVKQPNA